MKKFIIVLFIIVFSFTIVLADQMELLYNDEVHIYDGPSVNLILNGEKFTPSEAQMPPVIIENRTLVPVREVFEKFDGIVSWDADERKVGVKIDKTEIHLWIDKLNTLVNGEETLLDVPAKLINGKTMVPVRFISERGGLNVEWNGETTTVSITSPVKNEKITKIKAVNYTLLNDVKCIAIQTDGKVNYNTFTLKAEDDKPYRIVLDINNSEFDFDHNTIFADDDVVSQIRFGVQENDTNRIVVDMNGEEEYFIQEDASNNLLYILFSTKHDENVNSSEPTDNVEVNNNNDESNNKDEENIDENNNNDESTNNNEENTVPDSEEVIETINPDDTSKVDFTSKITSVKYSTASEKARIILDSKFEYELTELENPKRIALDFKESELALDGPSEVTLKNKAISKIVAVENEDGSARIVITMSENSSYEISKKTAELQVKVEEPSYKNVAYNNKNDYAEITLAGVDLSDLTKLQSKTSKKYTIKYSSSDFNPGSGAIEINDEFIKKISVTSTRITINDTGNIKYSAKQSGNDVVFTISKSDAKEEKIIILDAGHGGSDPGAINGNAQEKTYNLKVMLKLKDMLEDAGYTVYTTRESDVTLTVNDRVYLATKDYPEASLYVSIHHNSLDNKNYSGTLVMYCSRDTSKYGITNKQFATYVLNELVNKLGTVNRGFIEVKENDTSKRVLTEVNMPSILCEIAFISNDEEVARIKTDKFQNLAAEAIYNGIEKALADMN